MELVNYILKADSKANVFIFGIGIGGATALLSSDDLKQDNVKGIISDSAYSDVKEVFKEAQEILETVIEENNKIIADKMEYFSDIDLTYAETQEIEEYNNNIAAMEQMIAEENYIGAEEIFSNMDKLIYPYIKPEKELNLHVQQIDVSDFPNIKLYVQIEDAITKEVPTNLAQTLFYIGKKDANGNYIKQVANRLFDSANN